jgi:hypothetical protein
MEQSRWLLYRQQIGNSLGEGMAEEGKPRRLAAIVAIDERRLGLKRNDCGQ